MLQRILNYRPNKYPFQTALFIMYGVHAMCYHVMSIDLIVGLFVRYALNAHLIVVHAINLILVLLLHHAYTEYHLIKKTNYNGYRKTLQQRFKEVFDEKG